MNNVLFEHIAQCSHTKTKMYLQNIGQLSQMELTQELFS